MSRKAYKANIWKLYIFKFLKNLDFIGGVLVPFFMDWGGISFTQIMILQSIFVASIFLLEVPTGAIADRFGRRVSLALASLSTLAAVLVYTSYPHFALFVLGEILWGAGYALMSGADQSLMYDSLKKIKQEKKSKKFIGRLSSFDVIGIAVGAPFGSMIAQSLGLRFAMLIMAVPICLSFFLCFTFKEPVQKRKKHRKSYVEVFKGGVKYFRGHKILRVLAFDTVTFSALIFFIVWMYQPLLKQLDIQLMWFGWVLAGITVIELIFMNNFARLENFFGSKKNYLFLSALFSGIAFMTLGLTNSIAAVVFLIWVIGGFGLTRKYLFHNYLHKHIESHNRTTVMSTISMCEKFLAFVSYPLVGLLVERSLNQAFVVLGLVLIVLSIVSEVREEHLLD